MNTQVAIFEFILGVSHICPSGVDIWNTKTQQLIGQRSRSVSLINEGVRSRRSANEIIFEPERKSENYRILRSRSIASLRFSREFANDTRM